MIFQSQFGDTPVTNNRHSLCDVYIRHCRRWIASVMTDIYVIIDLKRLSKKKLSSHPTGLPGTNISFDIGFGLPASSTSFSPGH